MSFVDDFFRGQRDCQEGIPHKAGQSEAYDRGYSTEYQREEALSSQSELICDPPEDQIRGEQFEDKLDMYRREY